MNGETKVLCFFRYWFRRGGVTTEYSDSVMITAFNEHRIPIIFKAKMAALIPTWAIGPRPTTFELVGYITERGVYKKIKR